MAKSTYYFELKRQKGLGTRDLKLKEQIREIFDKNHGRYGVRRVHKTLANNGNAVNHKKIQRLMHEMGLKGKRPKEKYHSYKGEVGKIADNIIKRNFKAEKPLKKWSTDVSQFTLPWGKCFLSPILDMATNEIISYNLSLSPNLPLVTGMLDKAFEKFPRTEGLILHSDMGWQYQHRIYVNMLKDRGIVQSMSRKGNCYDNCIIETFFGRMKTEMFYGYEKEYSSFDIFAKAVHDYIDYYNNERIQQKTKWTPPAVCRKVSMMT
jgi:transposase InsO family protein